MRNYITRKRHGNHFRYSHRGRTLPPSETARIKKLAIPPAWESVEIAANINAKVLATGYDSAGRKQSIYNPKFRAVREKAKFDRILRFALALPALRQQLEKDLKRRKFTEQKVAACAVRLIDRGYFRVGNPTSAKDRESYGITTIRSKHIDISTTKVTFDFIGKSQQHHHKVIRDATIAKIVRQLDEQPGYELFQYTDADGQQHKLSSDAVNTYIKTHMGDEFSAKDFRTWGGTLHALTELIAVSSDIPQKKTVTECIKKVAKRLGNTPSIARASYIDPRVLDAYESGTVLQKLRETVKQMKPKKYLTSDELHLLTFLRQL